MLILRPSFTCASILNYFGLFWFELANMGYFRTHFYIRNQTTTILMKYFSILFIILLFGFSNIKAEQSAPHQIDQILKKVRASLKIDTDSALYWGGKALQIAKKTTDTIRLARCQSLMASVYKKTQAYDSALYYTQLCCDNYKATNTNNKKYMGSCIKLGELQQLMGRYQQASETYKQLLPLCDTLPKMMVHLNGALMNTKLLSCEYDRAFHYSSQLEELLNNMGNTKQVWQPWYAKAHVYFELKEYEKSIEYLNKMKAFADTSGLEHVNAIYHGIQSGIEVYYTKDYQKAQTHLQQSLNFWEKNKNREQIGFTSIFMGFTYGKLNDRANAEKYYAQAEQCLKPLGINKKIHELHRYMAETYYDWGEYHLSRKYATKALEMHKHFGLRIEIIDVYKILSDVEKAAGNHSMALDYLQLHNNYNDSIFSMARINGVKYMEQDYIEKEKQHKIDMLNLQKAQTDAMLAKQKQLNIVFAVVLVLFLIGGILAYSYMRQKRRLQTEETQRLALQSELKGQEEERNRIAKDLHDGVVSDLTGLKYHLNDLELDTPDLDDAVNRISVISSEIRFISHNLATPLFVNANLEEVLVQFAEEVSSKQNLEIKTIFYPAINWDDVSSVFQVEVYRVIQEIVSNTLKHANATGLTVNMVKHHDSFNIGIEDNGKGFIVGVQQSGIGIQNIKKRIEALGGELILESTPGSPTTYIIDVPLISVEQAIIS